MSHLKLSEPSNQNFDKHSTQKYTITYVLRRGYFNLVRYMLTMGIDPNQVSVEKELIGSTLDNSCTALILCTFIKDETWCLNVARNLLEHGAFLHRTDSRFLNAIHYCCAFGREKLLECYLGIFLINLFRFDFFQTLTWLLDFSSSLDSLDFDLSKAVDLNGNL